MNESNAIRIPSSGSRPSAVTSADAPVLAMAIAAIVFGCVGMAFGDFALQWQPVPSGLPGRHALAIASALAFILSGAATLVPATRRRGLIALSALTVAWVLLLQVPKIAMAPASVVAWLGVAEIGSIAIGTAMITFAEAGRDHVGAMRAMRVAFGLCAIVFGLSHFAYAQFTAAMVPAWLSAPLLWAYFTGAAHAAAGIAIASGRLVGLAAKLLATMCLSFVALLHLPRVAATPSVHAEWAMLAIAMLIGSAAWCVAAALPTSRKRARVER